MNNKKKALEFINRVVNGFIGELDQAVKECNGDYESIKIACPECDKNLKVVILDGRPRAVACECDFRMFLD